MNFGEKFVASFWFMVCAVVVSQGVNSSSLVHTFDVTYVMVCLMLKLGYKRKNLVDSKSV